MAVAAAARSDRRVAARGVRRWRGRRRRRAVRSVGDGLPQRGVPGLVAGRDTGMLARTGGHGGSRRQLHLIRDVAGHHETQTLACLRGDEHRVAEFGLLAFELVDLFAQRGLVAAS